MLFVIEMSLILTQVSKTKIYTKNGHIYTNTKEIKYLETFGRLAIQEKG
jgi:hypothetical protein